MFADAERETTGWGPTLTRLSALARGVAAFPYGSEETVDHRVPVAIEGLPADAEERMEALVEADARLAHIEERVKRARAVLQARLVREAGCALAGSDALLPRSDTPLRSQAVGQAAAMLSLATGENPGVARRRVAEAVALREDTPAIDAAVGEGRLSARRARVLVDVLAGTPHVLQERILPDLLTPQAQALPDVRFRRRAEALLLESDAAEAILRVERAQATRHVSHPRPAGAGMSRMSLLVPTVDARIIDTTLSSAAAWAHQVGDARTIPQLRADALAALAQHAREMGTIGCDADHVGGGTSGEGSENPTSGRAAQPAGAVGSNIEEIRPAAPPASALSTPAMRLTQVDAQIHVVVPVSLLLRAHHIAVAQTRQTPLPRAPGWPGGGRRRRRGSTGRHAPGATTTWGGLPAWMRELASRAGASGEAASGEAASGEAADGEREARSPSAPLPAEQRIPHQRGGVALDPATALALACGNPWRQILLAHDGTVVSVGRTRHDPPEALARWIRARDRTCVFPGCTVPAEECHLDHTLAWNAGGETSPTNLACLCPAHHALKHTRGWRLTQEAPGHFTWTSPTGAPYHAPGASGWTTAPEPARPDASGPPARDADEPFDTEPPF